jgi:dTMP kinase
VSLFIVFEGIDGCGAGTQSEILREKLMADSHILFLRYPEYNNPIGELIYKSLKEKLEFSKETFFMLFALDQAKDNPRIRNALEEGKVVLADRYFLSNLAFQCARGFDFDKALKVAEVLDLPKPDLVIFLKVSPETSVGRKTKEKRNLDSYEQNLELQKKVFEVYERLASENVFAKEWVTVDGERSVDEVASEIESIIKPRIKI